MATSSPEADPAANGGSMTAEREAADAQRTGEPGPVPDSSPADSTPAEWADDDELIARDAAGDDRAAAGADAPGAAGEDRSVAGGGTPGVTGDSRVDAVVAPLGELPGAPLDEHPAILGAVHDGLREVLGDIAGGAPPVRPHGPGASR